MRMEVCHTIFNNRLKSKKIPGYFLLLECGLLFEKNGGYLRTLKRKIMEEDSILLFNWKKNNGTNIYQNILIAIMPCKFDVVWQIKAPIIWLQSYQNFFSNCRMWITTWSSKWGYTRLRHYRLLRGKELNQTWSIQFFGEGIFPSA